MKSVVYFVGAGLSKSLERHTRIPVMADFVSVMADHLDDDVILFSLVSLDAERAFEYTRPEWIELAKKIRHLDKTDRTRQLRELYRDILKARPSENIETVLRNAGAERIRFGFAINRFFSALGWEVNATRLDEFLGKQLSQPDTKHAFVSFNYDLLLDSRVQALSAGRWHPRQGYGFVFNQYVTPDQVTEHLRQFPDPKPGVVAGGAFAMLECKPISWGEGPDRTDTIRILKPHGSLNFLAPFDGNYAFQGLPNCVVMHDNGALAYLHRYDTPNLWTVEREPVGNMAPFIVPPVKRKADILLEGEVNAALMTADEIYVIGWSMPETDDTFLELIDDAIDGRHTRVTRVVVINRNAPVEYFQRVAKIFGQRIEDLEILNSGF